MANDDESPSDRERYRCRTSRVINQRQTRPGAGGSISPPPSAIPHLTHEDPDEPESTRENRKHDIEEECKAAVLLLCSHSYDDLSRSSWRGNDAESRAAARRFDYRPMRTAPRPHITSLRPPDSVSHNLGGSTHGIQDDDFPLSTIAGNQVDAPNSDRMSPPHSAESHTAAAASRPS